MTYLHPLMLAAILSLGACGTTPFSRKAPPEVTIPPGQGDTGLRPRPRPNGASVRPTAGAVTAEALDTTTKAQRQEAAKVDDTGGEVLLGKTIASLGDPTEPGFWLKTPLVTKVRSGRVVYLASGASAQVELRPLDGAARAGSRISLAALRLLNAPLTGLPELEVFGTK